MTADDPTSKLIAARGKVHGDFRFQGGCSQELKDIARKQPNWNALPGYVKEGIDMILLKVSRALNGDWAEADHYDDIGGYARCISERLPEDRGERAKYVK